MIVNSGYTLVNLKTLKTTDATTGQLNQNLWAWDLCISIFIRTSSGSDGHEEWESLNGLVYIPSSSISMILK